jgi:ketosteroid isomerase-like protein
MVPKHVEGWWVVALLFAAAGMSGCGGTRAGTNRAVPPQGAPQVAQPPGSAATPGAPVERDPTAPAVAEPKPAAEGQDAAARPALTLSALRREAQRVVDDWHAAAAVGDAPRYLGHMADDAVFMGTDSTERWDLTEFRAYVEQHMTAGKGWVYVPSDRGLVVPEGSELAWFDERLANEKYGELRGTGVLRRDGDTWRIVHYSMTYTVPNAVARAVADLIRGE